MFFKGPVINTLLCRLAHNADLLEELNKICEENRITVGSLSVIGAVKSAKVGFYNQTKKKYETIAFNEPLEIASCMGNISLKDGKPFAHTHITLSDEKGKVYGGHLMPGAIIFAAEACIRQLDGDPPVRGYDSVTGLPLWEEKNE